MNEVARAALRRYRTDGDITQGKLGAQLGVTATAVCEWEKGTRRPKRPIARMLEDISGIPWRSWYGETEEGTGTGEAA